MANLLVNVDEAAQLARVSVGQIRVWQARGYLAVAGHLGTRVLYDPREVMRVESEVRARRVARGGAGLPVRAGQ